jgi:hypothetical protein
MPVRVVVNAVLGADACGQQVASVGNRAGEPPS